jgi:tetratricopeptide (TPR) repeat protein
VNEFEKFFELAPPAPSLSAEAGIIAAEDWYFLGYREWETGNLAEAENSFAKAVHNHGGNARAWYWLGRVRMEQGDHTGASQAFSHAAALQPNDELARYFKEREIRSANVGGKAWEAFERGILAYGQERFADAAVDFKSAMALNPGWLEARYWYARVCIVDLDRIAEGRRIVDKMSAEEKQDPRVQYLIKVLKWK